MMRDFLKNILKKQTKHLDIKSTTLWKVCWVWLRADTVEEKIRELRTSQNKRDGKKGWENMYKM